MAVMRRTARIDQALGPARDLMLKFMEHFAGIREAMDAQEMWDDTDGLAYDRLVTADGTSIPVKVRSMVGVIPLLAVVDARRADAGSGQDGWQAVREFPRASGLRRYRLSCKQVGSLRGEARDRHCSSASWRRGQLRRVFAKLFDEAEFLSPHGLRSISAYHRDHPYVLEVPVCARRSTTSPPSPRPLCSAVTPTGAGRSGCRSTTCW